MINVLYGCIVDQHNANLVALAVTLCVFSCFSAVNLFIHAAEAQGQPRIVWHCLAAVVFGSGVWATHFVAELAYRPGIPIAYDLAPTILSIAIAIMITWVGLKVTLDARAAAAGGALLGTAVGAMHYLGMVGLEVPGQLHWDISIVAASLIVGIAGCAAAMHVLSRGTAWYYRCLAAMLLVFAIAGLHFTGMSAISLRLDPSIVVPDQTISSDMLAITVTAVSLLIIALGLSTAYADERLARRARGEAERLAHAQRIAGIGFFERDLRSGVITYSDEFLAIWGLTSSGTPPSAEYLAAFVHPEDRRQFLAGRAIALDHNARAPQDMRVRRPDGEERILHREFGIICNEQGKPIRLFGTIQDVTDRKRAEIEIKRSRENLARAQRIAQVGSIERDLITGEVRVSEEFCRIHGIAPDDRAIGADYFRDLVHIDDRDAFDEANRQIACRIAPRPLDFRIRRSDGSARTLHRECEFVADKTGKPVSFVATVQDITERCVGEARERELAQHLEHSQKLEALGTLAGGIAHDINNTLVPILALSKMGLRQTPAETAAGGYFKTIYEASLRARDLVGRVLAFSRKESAEKSFVHLDEVVTEALELLRATIPASIQIDARVSKVPATLADSSQIHQVITNLVSNAAGAIGSGVGTIAIVLEATAEAAGKSDIHLAVADTGQGMTEATKSRIFEPFFTTKDVGEGTGLGLSIVHGIIAGHGGHIEVDSHPGAGTRFDIYIPLQAPAGTIAAAA